MNTEQLETLFQEAEEHLMGKSVLEGTAPRSMIGVILTPEAYDDGIKCLITIECTKNENLDDDDLESISDTVSDYLRENWDLNTKLTQIGIDSDTLNWWPVCTQVNTPDVKRAPEVKHTPEAKYTNDFTNTSVTEIVRGYSTKIIDNKVFFAPDIPPQKLANAIKAFAPLAAQENVLVLIDNTVFGSAKEGGLLTECNFYTRSLLEKPLSIALNKINNVTFIEGSTSYLHVNNQKFLNVNCPDKKSIRSFMNMLLDIKSNLHSTPTIKSVPPTLPVPSAPSAVDALRMLKALKDEGLLTDAEYEEKRKPHLKNL